MEKIIKIIKKKNNFPIHPTPKGGGLSWEFVVTGTLPYRILERYTILFFIHWWGTPVFAPPHLHQTYKEAHDYIKEMCPNAVIEASLETIEKVRDYE